MRTIDADALIEWIDMGHLRHPTELCFSEMDVVNIINHQPTIEPQRMKGRWETDAYGAMDDGEYLVTRCNICGTVYEYGHNDRYCGFCGAAMEAQNETS